MCVPYFVKVNKNSFQLQTLLFFVHLRSQQKRTEKVISNYQIYSCHFDVVILRVAIICLPSALTELKSNVHCYVLWTKAKMSVLIFFQVRCAHKSGDVINFIILACRISSRLKWYKNYKNRLRLAKVIVKNKMSRFYGSLCMYICVTQLPCRTSINSSKITQRNLQKYTAKLCQTTYWRIHA